MKKHHWIGALVVLLVGYAIGVKWPNLGAAVKEKVSGAASAA